MLLASIMIFSCQQQPPRETKVLVFSKTEGYRHESIPDGIKAIQEMGSREGFTVDASEDAADFNEENLAQYAAIVFLSTTGDILDYQQQVHLERYIQAGGGFVGIHAATDTEYEWPWYNKLVGAYFESHPNNPNVREATCTVVDHGHQASDSLPDSFQKVDEFYNFRSINPDINVLVTIDESTYEGGTNGDNHPMVWYHEYDGGRAFYTAFGHTSESFEEPEFLEQLSGGLAYAIGEASPLNYATARYEPIPQPNRFTKVTLDYNLDEPTELSILPDGRILFLERKGNVKMYKPDLDSTILVKKFNSYIGENTQPRHEDGMLGMAIDPNFAENNWVYIFYSPAADKPVQNLSRFELKGDELDMDSEIVMLEVPVQRVQCCHTGGSVEFGPDGNLFLSTGDDTNPFESDGFSPSDERPNRTYWDAQRTSGNTNDLRGKILRITPQADGTYTIPEGNLFPPGTPNTKPEIYVMGCRNPYRIAIDQKSGYLYWGDVGPDAGNMSEVRGPHGIDEFNQARKAGFFGWPYFTANNMAYAEHDFATNTTGEFFDPAQPINNSPNNTGLTELPPAQEAMIYYSYGESSIWPMLGNGGKNAMAGPIYYGENYPDSPNKYPEYFEGKPLFYDWMRSTVYLVTLDENGDYEKLEPFMPEADFNAPMDMEYGPDGKLYMLEYGTGWFTRNMDAKLVRIDYDAGNRPPVAEFIADKTIGSAPLTVQFSDESEDFDGDDLTYAWQFQNGATSGDVNPEFTFNAEGAYEVSLTVTDSEGQSTSKTMTIEVGNEPPQLEVQLEGNQTFFWDNRALNYKVTAKDSEDGSTEDGGINPEEVLIKMTFIEEATKETLQGHQSNDELQHALTGSRLIEGADCKACHAIDKTSVGPSYMQVAEKYQKDTNAETYLSGKIIAGGGGVWGENAMAAHPDLSEDDARKMARYILSLGAEGPAPLAMEGTYDAKEHIGKKPGGAYVLQASYTDKGAEKAGPASGQTSLTLRSTNVIATDFDYMDGAQIFKNNDISVVILSDPTVLRFDKIDLTDVQALAFGGFAMGNEGNATIEVHLGSADGPLIASALMQAAPVEIQPGIFAAQAQVPIEATEGIHDLYFTVKAAQPGKPLGGLGTIDFKMKP